MDWDNGCGTIFKKQNSPPHKLLGGQNVSSDELSQQSSTGQSSPRRKKVKILPIPLSTL